VGGNSPFFWKGIKPLMRVRSKACAAPTAACAAARVRRRCFHRIRKSRQSTMENRDEYKEPAPLAEVYFKRVAVVTATPSRGSEYAAGYDLYSAEEVTVHSGCVGLISTGLQIQMPIGVYGRIAPRSGLAISNMISVGGGVIDPDYRGTIVVILFNHGQSPFHVRQLTRIAQIIFEKIQSFKWVESKHLDTTHRKDRGFGSTGVELKRTFENFY
jgi:dUTP pyrophosphatase